MRWKKYLTVSAIAELIEQHNANGLAGPEIVTAIVNSHGDEYKLNIVKIFNIISTKGY